MRPAFKYVLLTVLVLIGFVTFYFLEPLLPPEPSSTSRGGEETQAAHGIPQFPWPPPKASAFVKIPNELVSGTGDKRFLRDVASHLERAFDAAGYAEWSYHSVPNGFALVSRIEQIRADGTPREEAARWSVSAVRPKIVSLSDYVEALFKAPRGRYRLIVFIVTDLPVTQTRNEPTRAEATEWLNSGALSLPPSIGGRPYSGDCYTTALIYEFERGAGDEGAGLKIPSDLQGKTHLERAGIWSKLRG